MDAVRRTPIPVTRGGGQILAEVAAEGKVQQLAAPADAEDGPARRRKAADQRQLPQVPVEIDIPAEQVFLAVKGRVAVAPAAQQKTGAATGGGKIAADPGPQSRGGQSRRVIFEKVRRAVAVQENGGRARHGRASSPFSLLFSPSFSPALSLSAGAPGTISPPTSMISSGISGTSSFVFG